MQIRNLKEEVDQIAQNKNLVKLNNINLSKK